MTLEELNLLIDYHYWARDQALAAAEALTNEQFTRDLGNSFKSVRSTMGHLIGAEIVWLSRWRGAAVALPSPDPYPDLRAVRAAWLDSEQQVRAFMGGLKEQDATRVFSYKTLKGEEQSSVFWHMLQHVVNHGTYHRGQVTTMLRQLGAVPKPMDLVLFYRLRAGKAQKTSH